MRVEGSSPEAVAICSLLLSGMAAAYGDLPLTLLLVDAGGQECVRETLDGDRWECVIDTSYRHPWPSLVDRPEPALCPGLAGPPAALLAGSARRVPCRVSSSHAGPSGLSASALIAEAVAAAGRCLAWERWGGLDSELWDGPLAADLVAFGVRAASAEAVTSPRRWFAEAFATRLLAEPDEDPYPELESLLALRP